MMTNADTPTLESSLPDGFELAKDEDGDWVLIPPPDVSA